MDGGENWHVEASVRSFTTSGGQMIWLYRFRGRFYALCAELITIALERMVGNIVGIIVLDA